MIFDLLVKINDHGFFDKIYSRIGNAKNKTKIRNTNFKRIQIQSQDNLTWVCFLPWRTSFKLAQKIGLIPKKGKVIVYEGPEGIINPNPKVAKRLLKKVIQDLAKLKLKEFNIISYSAGNYFAFYIANHFKIKKLIAVVPGSTLGSVIYTSLVTKNIKKEALELGYDNMFQYDINIKETNPIMNLSNLPNDIEIHIATHDFYVPTIYGKELIKELKKYKNPKIIEHKNKGHVLTLLSFGKNNPY